MKTTAVDTGRVPAASKAVKPVRKGKGAPAHKNDVSLGGKNLRPKKISESGGKTKSQKNPFHMKKALKKRIDLIEQYKQLKSKGSLEEFMSKRRKKMVLRDHRLVPRTRNEGVPRLGTDK